MSFPFKSLVFLLSIVTVSGAEKDKAKFEAGPASSFEARQTIDGVTIGARAFYTEELTGTAFGKLNPNKYTVLPVLVAMQNDRGKTLSLDKLRVQYLVPGKDEIEATPATDVKYIAGPTKPRTAPSPIPIPRGKKKGPLTAWEIEGRAFAAKMLPAGQSASGFFYFQVLHRQGARLYITGIRETGSGKELFYFEIPLDGGQ